MYLCVFFVRTYGTCLGIHPGLRLPSRFHAYRYGGPTTGSKWWWGRHGPDWKQHRNDVLPILPFRVNLWHLRASQNVVWYHASSTTVRSCHQGLDHKDGTTFYFSCVFFVMYSFHKCPNWMTKCSISSHQGAQVSVLPCLCHRPSSAYGYAGILFVDTVWKCVCVASLFSILAFPLLLCCLLLGGGIYLGWVRYPFRTMMLFG